MGASAAGRACAEAGLGCAISAARRGRALGRRGMWAAARRVSARWSSPLAPPRHARTSTSAPARSTPSAQAAAPAPAELAAARREAGHQAADAAARATSGAAEAAAPTASSVAAAAARAAAALRRPAVPAVRAFSPQQNHYKRLGATLHSRLQRQVQAMLHAAGEGCTCGAGVEDPAAQGGQQRAVAAPGITSSGQHLRHDVAHRACRRARHESAQRVSRCACKHAARLCLRSVTHPSVVPCATQTSAQHVQTQVPGVVRDKARRGARSPALPPCLRSSPKRTLHGRPRLPAASPRGPAGYSAGRHRCGRCLKHHGPVSPPIASTVPAATTLCKWSTPAFRVPLQDVSLPLQGGTPGVHTTTWAARALLLATCSLRQGAPCTAPTRTRERDGCAHLSTGVCRKNAQGEGARGARAQPRLR